HSHLLSLLSLSLFFLPRFLHLLALHSFPTRRSSDLVLILGTIVSLGFGPLSFIQLLGLGLLDFFDFISNSVLMPIVAILTCICVGHFIGPKVIEDEVELNGPFKIKKFYRIMLKWIAPIFLALILIFAISETMGWIVV